MRLCRELFLCDQGLTQVPRDVAEQRGPYVTSLNLSENALKTGEGLELFVKLDTLVLDKNGLENLDGFPKLPTVTVLWMNDNKVRLAQRRLEPTHGTHALRCPVRQVSDLPTFYTQVRELFPALNFFCLMRNPASPPFAAMSEGDAKKIRQFRLFTIYSLPTLQFLDSSPVSPEERADAKKRGKYMAVRKVSVRGVGGCTRPLDLTPLCCSRRAA